MFSGNGYRPGGYLGVGNMFGQRVSPLLGGPRHEINIRNSGGVSGGGGAPMPYGGGDAPIDPAALGGLLGMIGNDKAPPIPEGVASNSIQALQPENMPEGMDMEAWLKSQIQNPANLGWTWPGR